MERTYDAIADLDGAYRCNFIGLQEYTEGLDAIIEWQSEIKAEEAGVKFYERDAESWESEFGEQIAF